MAKEDNGLNYKGEPRQRKVYGSIDVVDLERLARLHLTNRELAEWFNVNENTLALEPYKHIIAKGKSETKQRLKQKAIQRALIDDSDTMLIFCLKNYCGWSNNEKQEQGDQPVAPAINIQFT